MLHPQPSPATQAPRRRLAPLTLALATGLAGSLAGACGDSTAEAGAAASLRFGAIPDQNSTELVAKLSLVAKHLSEQLGVSVEYAPVSDYAALVDAFKSGDVQLAWFGGLTHVQAREAVPGARALAQGAIDPHFVSYFVASAESGLEPGADFPMAMEGKLFTFGSTSSTSGRLMPERFIRDATGKTPEQFFGRPNAFSGSHDKTAKLVEAGTYDCGALNYKVYDAMVREGKLDPARCIKIWTTPEYPDYNWTAHPILEERYGAGFTERLKAVLVGIDDADLLRAMQREEGLIAASNADFDEVERTMRDIGDLR